MTRNANLLGRGMVADKISKANSLQKQKFGFSPFSVWRTTDKFWMERRREWIQRYGIQGECGRSAAANPSTESFKRLLKDSKAPKEKFNEAKEADAPPGVSVFDPCLAELCYHWWCPPGGIILDPFAGGSSRGMVASALGYKYWGCELRGEQVAANVAQWAALPVADRGAFKPRWVEGDSLHRMRTAPIGDFIFTCPPYGDLEVYSDNPADISNMGYGCFAETYTAILSETAKRLMDDSFACIVVGNYRCKKTGIMRDLVGGTVGAMQFAGLQFYNDIVLINPVGTGAMRVNTSFKRGNRKVVKLHQNVLVFVKGDPAKAAAKIPFDIEVANNSEKELQEEN